MNKIKIFLADDHSILREGLSLMLKSDPRFEIIGEASDGKEAIDKIEKLMPDLVILDISMPTMTGIEVTRQLRKYHPGIRIIILSMHDNNEYIDKLIKLGISGYLLKDTVVSEVINAVSEVMKGNYYLSPKIMNKMLTNLSGKTLSEPDSDAKSIFTVLSNREIEVLKLIGESKSSVEIATLLRISEKTVKTHRSNIMKKLDMHKLADLVKYAIKNGLVES